MEIKAKMPGKVSTVHVQVGDSVTKGQKVMVCEMMKMETPMPSPCDGTVKAINAEPGGRVAAGQVLMVIE